MGTSRSPPDVPDGGALVELASRHRLEGFLTAHQEGLRLAESVCSALSQSQMHRAQLGLSQWASTIELSRLFTRHAIPHLVFKGRALTILTGAEGEGRGGGDVDLLVPPRKVPEAHTLLKAEGYLPVYAIEPVTRIGWALITYRNREMPYRAEHVEVDLHWRISSESDFLPATEVLIERSVSQGNPGQEFRTLCPTDSLAACAFHFFYDYAGALRRLVDFARLSWLVDDTALSTLPRRTRQLIADTSALCEELFGHQSVNRLPLPEPHPKNLAYMRQLFWSGQGAFSHEKRFANPVTRAWANFHHTSRYTSTLRLVFRLIARGIVWFPPSSPEKRGWGIPRAMVAQFTRVLRGRFDSQV